MDLTHSLAGLAALALAFAVVVSTDDAKRVGLLLILAVPQVYVVDVAGVYVSAEVGLAVALLPIAVARLNRRHRSGARLVVAYLACELLSMLWSSDLRLAEKTILYQVPFLVVLCLSFSAARSNPGRIAGGLKVFAALAAAEALAVVAFRVSPVLEHSFLTSRAARILINPNSLAALFTTAPDNVIDPSKAGGIFTNANVAAAFLGVSGLIIAGLAIAERSRSLGTVAFVLVVAVLFTGSSIGALLAVLLPLLLWAISTGRGRRIRPGRIFALAAICVPVAMLQMVGAIHIAGDKAASANSRLLIWKFAARSFAHRPVLGQGFGGWQRTFPTYAQGRDLTASFPPHNSLIYAWSQAGLFACVFGVGALVWFEVALRQARLAQDRVYWVLAGATAVGLIWLFVHGFFENYGLFGDEHMQPVVAAAIGLCLGSMSDRANAIGRNNGPGRSDLSEPTLSTV